MAQMPVETHAGTTIRFDEECGMFDEGQLYAPVRKNEAGEVVVVLGDGHPGVADAAYRARRNAIAAAATEWQPNAPLPMVDYTDDEHDVWAVVSRELQPLHQQLACGEFLVGQQRLRLPTDHIPQLHEVSAGVQELTGFRYHPAAGLVPLREFYGSLADGVFHSTQYIRHHSVPLYTPEPDVIHEVLGHGNCLASDRFAALDRAAGGAARRVESDEALEFVSKVFWFSLEFGVLREGGRVKTYGAGLLSSFGEIQEMARADLLDLDVGRMGTQQYDITHYQPLLFCAESFDHVEDVIGEFFANATDDSIASLSEGARLTA
jgi:phenylalanine-4-hydroxylase